jgi:alpha-methylacyl-CoA racemase
MFTFAWYALALGAAAKFPKPGEMWLVGASPRYQLYPTKDGRIVACGAIEQKFWEAFSAAIGLAAEFFDDKRDPAATRNAIAKLILAKTADEWRTILAAADCCATIVTPLEEAIRDPHFVQRGLFAHQVATASGKALPVPIAPAFRERPGTKTAPKLDEN